MVELVHNSDEKSTASVKKVSLTANVPLKLFWGSHTYIHVHTLYNNWTPARSHNSMLAHACAG